MFASFNIVVCADVVNTTFLTSSQESSLTTTEAVCVYFKYLLDQGLLVAVLEVGENREI